MKPQKLDPNDLKLWMSENYIMMAGLSGGPPESGKQRLRLEVNCCNLIRVTLGSEIIYHSSDADEAVRIFNENV